VRAQVITSEAHLGCIDDTFCVAHGGQQLAFWNAHHDERGFAPTTTFATNESGRKAPRLRSRQGAGDESYHKPWPSKSACSKT
jgi:hypothetical protein